MPITLDDALAEFDQHFADHNFSEHFKAAACVAEYITQLERIAGMDGCIEARAAAEKYANAPADDDGDECQSCHNGTLEIVGDEVRCRGECGAIMKMTEVTTPHYEVIVGNIGTVYRGADRSEAFHSYNAYVEMSMENAGRAAGEPVTLMEDGEPIKEHEGAVDAIPR